MRRAGSEIVGETHGGRLASRGRPLSWVKPEMPHGQKIHSAVRQKCRSMRVGSMDDGTTRTGPEVSTGGLVSARGYPTFEVDVRVDGVQAEVNLLKRVVGRDEDRAPMSEVKVPNPKPFGGIVRDYVKEFSSLMLDIRDMSEEDKLFNFLSGLQTWAQTKLRRQGVKDLPSAIAAVDRLVDFRVPNICDLEKKKKDSGKEKGKSSKGGRMESLKKKKHQ
ncbi:hypothetical protein Sango_2997100 [Sesamum angolense]|uniref:Uncharacterized protein n=1 Tax=Sesamum angolense TaxID=2727404 RepID=A0AAE1T426_9LAMI|nr:hypothetical protein Sango_2997100 [Sesamum angolense]